MLTTAKENLNRGGMLTFVKENDAGSGAKPISHQDTRNELGEGIPWGNLI